MICLISDKMMEIAKGNLDAYIKLMEKMLEDDRIPKALAKYSKTFYDELVKQGFTPKQAIDLISLPLE